MKRRTRIGLRGWMLAAAVGFASPTQAAELRFNDTQAGNQHYINQLNFPTAWGALDRLPARHRVTVAVLDTGFNTQHNDLRGRFMRGFNAVSGGTDVSPVNPHGTAVAGTIGARAGNGRGITGLAPDSRILPVRVSNRSDGSAYVSVMANAIRRAADRGARVINLSYSGVQHEVLNRAARYASRRGAVVFMAAGNEGQLREDWDNHRFLLAIGAVRPDNRIAGFSNRGGFVDFVAPGTNIRTTNESGGYGGWSGTSFASPIAASVAALVYSANPELTPTQVRNILYRSVRDLGEEGFDSTFGHGLIDAGRAVELALKLEGAYDRRRRLWSLDDTPGVAAALSGTATVSSAARVSASSVVPEPGVLMLTLSGAAWIGTRRRRGVCQSF